MKLIHCADIHLGSKLESKFPTAKTQTRRAEVLSTFTRMVDYAEQNNIKVIIMSGDVFDSDSPATKYKEFFYKTIKKHPNIDFLYLKGNHDSDSSYEETYDNLKLFNKDNFTSYEYDDVVISGIEIDADNSSAFYSQLNLDMSKLNIVMLHGDVSSSVGKDKVKVEKLKNKGIDYLALGHIHSYSTGSIDDRGVYAFPGCLEGRGFDECGDKGFIELTIKDGKIKHEFKKFAIRTIHDIEVDLTGCENLFDINNKISDKVEFIPEDDILEITLVGELDTSVEYELDDLIAQFEGQFFFVHFKDKTLFKIKIEDYENDQSLIGEFVRGVFQNEEYSDEEKQMIAAYGIRFINGREVR